jgi:hypothetical protein
MTVAGERYGLYGLIAQEREANARPMEFEEQNVGDTGGLLIYETDDRDEAKRIYQAGGFERGGQWHVVTRVEDREKDLTMRQTHRMPDKRDYDQT